MNAGRAREREPSQQTPSRPDAAPAPAASLASAIGNQAMARVARRLAAKPRARAAAAVQSATGLRTLARNGPDAGVLDPPRDAGVPVPAGVPDGDMAPPPAAQQQAPPAPAPAPAPPAAPAPDRDTLVRDAINRVLTDFQGLTITVPAAMPPTPGRHPHRHPPAQAPAAPAAPVAPAAPTIVTFASPYYINRSSGGGSGAHSLGGAGVAAWFNALPAAVRVGKGTPEQLTAAMQQAVDAGLLNGTWPPTAVSARDFMRTTGLGVDCSGFVYQAMMAADAALTGAGMTGLTTPESTGITDTGSQSIGAAGHTRIKSPADLQVGDIIQMAPNASSAVGHIRILTAVRSVAGFVEYDTDESTTRVGSGPQGSTWRLPAAGPMDTAHLEVQDAAGAWQAEPSGRPSTYWRRLAVAPAPAAAAPTVSPKLARRAVLSRAPSRTGGWNQTDRDVTGTWRIQATGLSQGLANDSANPATNEEAQHRAVAIVPQSVTNTNLEVLLHFHGNNLGERERTSPSDSGMAAGTVRDVEADLIPQQLAASGRNMIAILPQGTVSSGTLRTKFGITDPQAYVTEVLGQVTTHINALDPTRNLQALTPVRVVVSGHSGGGPTTVAAANALQAGAQASDDDWVASSPLLLFDAINGPYELDDAANMMERWLNEDARRLAAHTPADAEALLRRRGIKLRSTYTGGVYHVCNSKRPPRSYDYRGTEVTVASERSLEGRRDRWFSDHGGALGTLSSILLGQYVIEHVGGSHDFTVGTGHHETGPHTAVPGVTQAPHAPAGSNEAPTASAGSLAHALGMLGPADRVQSGSAAATPAAPTPSVARMIRIARQGRPPAAPVATRQPPGASGTHGSDRYVVYQDEVRVGGTKAWRNNNPGNIVGGAFANSNGAIGTAFGMAVFPDEATGSAAIPALLKTSAYQARTIRQAITAYAPPNENDTEGYIRSVVRGAGALDTTLLSALSDEQLDLIVGVIRRVEGWAAGQTFDRSGPDWVQALLGPAPGASAAPAGGTPDAGTDAGPPDGGVR